MFNNNRLEQQSIYAENRRKWIESMQKNAEKHCTPNRNAIPSMVPPLRMRAEDRLAAYNMPTMYVYPSTPYLSGQVLFNKGQYNRDQLLQNGFIESPMLRARF
jgi:hypothetical protein